ncbi:hypothetical protein QFZ73_005254 [Peribacillus sp. V2I11]|nr:hypothetical protein [Peribacillus sp. V2I11]
MLKPLQALYVTLGSDAEAYVVKRFPHKTVKSVGNGLRSNTIRDLINLMPHAFQPKQASGLNSTYLFAFTGYETRQTTIDIRDNTIQIRDGFHGKPDIGLRWIAKRGLRSWRRNKMWRRHF